MFALEAVLDGIAHLLQRFKAKRLGQSVVDGERTGRLDRFDRDLESGILAGDMRRHVIGRKRHLDGARLAQLHADDLLLEAGDEGPRADLHGNVVALATLERDTINAAYERNNGTIALLDL